MEFKDKVVLLVDDSIVRGTTSREIVQMAREAGANKVYLASAAPPVRFPNVYGIDMDDFRDRFAHGDAELTANYAIVTKGMVRKAYIEARDGREIR